MARRKPEMRHPGAPVAAQTNDTVLSEIVRRLVEALRPERMYLFGSHARGEAGADSDSTC